VFEHSEAVSDTLQGGIMDGYVSGPYTLEKRGVLVGEDFSVNPMGCRPKTNGRLSIIVDASAPHDKDGSVPGWVWSPKLPGSCNSSRMLSVPRFVRTLYRVGRGRGSVRLTRPVLASTSSSAGRTGACRSWSGAAARGRRRTSPRCSLRWGSWWTSGHW
jgi:hypothetical protein